ncbi:helix-turn-helix domain-containing protein [Vagococcus salmoninarum]
MAYLSGTSRETAGKILKELKAKKKITYQYKKFVILDPSYFQKVN